MASRTFGGFLSVAVLASIAAFTASAQSFRVQCPTSTITHPVAANNNLEPSYTGPTALTPAQGVPGAEREYGERRGQVPTDFGR